MLPSTQAPLKGITVSDLHLFTSRTLISEFLPTMHSLTTDANLCVLNGDIFDFKWSVLGTFETSISTAVEWLESLAVDIPGCQFVIIQGNHDCHTSYSEALSEVCRSLNNLHWFEHHFLLGNKIFLHGDVGTGVASESSVMRRRARHSHRYAHSKIHRIAYWTASRSGIAGRLPRFLPWRRQVRQVDKMLRAELGRRFDPITDVYLGHTHVAFEDFHFGGRNYHNCGAPINGAQFRAIEFEFVHDELHGSLNAPTVAETPEPDTK